MAQGRARDGLSELLGKAGATLFILKFPVKGVSSDQERILLRY
jgi:hypothetical protein